MRAPSLVVPVNFKLRKLKKRSAAEGLSGMGECVWKGGGGGVDVVEKHNAGKLEGIYP